MVFIYNGTLALKKEGNSAICDSMDTTWGPHAERVNQSQVDKYCIILFIWDV